MKHGARDWTIRTRDDLIYALTIAAELEHLLCCQYLYAAYSLKRSEVEGLTPPQSAMVQRWTTLLCEIARQEMAHLGLVNNLLTAIGGAPHLGRPNFPQHEHTYTFAHPIELKPLSRAWLDELIEVERPRGEVPDPLGPHTRVPTSPSFGDLQALYAQIRKAFEELEPVGGLLIGAQEPQVDTSDVLAAEVDRVYHFAVHAIRTRDDAVSAVDQIVAEGEGAQCAPEVPSHFSRLEAIRNEYEAELARDPAFAPTRNVVDNPTARRDHRFAEPGSYLENELARQLADVSNTAYEVLLFVLVRFYTRTDETAQELAALQRVAFFPLMTMIIRPACEMLTTLPAHSGESDGQCAGPPFEMYASVQFLPDKRNAWVVIAERLRELRDGCLRCWQLAAGNPEVQERLGFMHQNLRRMVRNFEAQMQLPATPERRGVRV